jgi:carbonic anhydrase/acetyltransferase-like protein (isoleucine patch superfamily)
VILAFDGRQPVLAEGVWIAPTAVVTGDVEVGDHSSIWFQTVVRGDESPIRIGREVNVQDASVLHTGSQSGLRIADRVSVGHMVLLHGCEIGEGTLVGMGSIVMDGAVIGRRCIVAAGSLVTAGSRFEDESVVMGRPAKVVRSVTVEEIEKNERRVQKYIRSAAMYAGRR